MKPGRRARQKVIAEKEISPNPARKRGAPRGSRNAAKPGEDLRLELFFSKSRRFFLEEWYENQFGCKPTEAQLRETARNLALNAIDRLVWEDYRQRHPELLNSGGEVF